MAQNRIGHLSFAKLQNESTYSFQTGVIGDNVHINCAAIAIPETDGVFWKYHGQPIDDGKLGRSFGWKITEGIKHRIILDKKNIKVCFCIEPSRGVTANF